MAQEQQTVEAHKVDLEAYTYALDVVSTIAFSSTDLLAKNNVRCLRILALPKNYSLEIDLAAHILVNTACGHTADVIQLPGIVEFDDPASPPMLGVFAREGIYLEKIYLACLPLPLHLGSVDGHKKWVSDSDLKPIKLELVRRVTEIYDYDGTGRKKEYAAWLKSTSFPLFRGLQISTEAHIQSFYQGPKFAKNLSKVYDAVEVKIRKGAKADAGAPAAPKASSSDAVQVAKSAELATLDTRINQLYELKDGVKTVINHFSVPLSHRIIEFVIEPDTLEGDWVKELLKCVCPN